METIRNKKFRKRNNEYIIVKPRKIFTSLTQVTKEIRKLKSGFRVAKLLNGIHVICGKCTMQRGKNSFKFCPHCGTRY